MPMHPTFHFQTRKQYIRTLARLHITDLLALAVEAREGGPVAGLAGAVVIDGADCEERGLARLVHKYRVDEKRRRWNAEMGSQDTHHSKRLCNDTRSL